MPLTGVFPSRDGAVVLVGAFKRNPLRDISTALEIEDLSADPRFASMARMFENRPELQAILRQRFAEESTAHWIAALAVVLTSLPVTLASSLAELDYVVLDGRVVHEPEDRDTEEVK